MLSRDDAEREDDALSGAIDAFPKRVAKLIQTSLRSDVSPFDRMTYPDALDHGRLQFPERYVSLYGHPVYAELSDEQRWKLSLLEMVNFFSINIHGERALVRDLVGRLYRNIGPLDSNETSRYLQHFIHEENAHTFMLAEYCVRYAGGVMPDMSTPIVSDDLAAGVGDILLFGRVFVLETFLSFLNRKAMADDGIDPTARKVNHLHHLDETRHIAFDRALLCCLVESARGRGAAEALDGVKSQIRSYAEYVVRRLYNPAVYRRAGIPNALQLANEARELPGRKETIQEWLSHGGAILQRIGLA